MDNKKFEQLIDLIINENEEQARELFHEIVVEKSREIYENIMMDEMMADDMDEGMGGQVGDMMDEISAEQSGDVVEGDDDMDMGDEEEVIDIDADDESEGEEHEEIEDAVVRIEDKLDQLMAEFEEIMGRDEGEEDFGDEEGEEDFGDEEGAEELAEEADEEEDDAEDLDEEVMEAITLKKVSVTHGDNGANAKSIALHEPKIKTPGVNPVKFSGASEAVPSSPKGPSNFYSKGESEVKHAKQWKNAPAQAGQDLEKAPAPKKGDDGSNTKSPLGESKKSVKKIIKK